MDPKRLNVSSSYAAKLEERSERAKKARRERPFADMFIDQHYHQKTEDYGNDVNIDDVQQMDNVDDVQSELSSALQSSEISLVGEEEPEHTEGDDEVEENVALNRAKEEFLVSSLIEEFMQMNSASCSSPYAKNEHDVPLTAGSTYKVNEFCHEYHSLASNDGYTTAQSLRLFNLLKKFLPDVNWPIDSSGNRLLLDEHCPSDIRMYSVDCCDGGCCAFILKLSNLIQCPKSSCGKYRFAQCRKDGCSRGVLCNPFIGGHHSKKYRFANRKAYYRPLIPLLKELIYWSVTNKKDIFYNNQEAFARRTCAGTKKESESVDDINQSKQAKFHMNEMSENFKRVQLANPEVELLEFSFILSVFYDGGVLYKRQSKSIWPLVVTLLNCNPDDRNEIGIAMFLIALHDLSVGSNAEQQIFKELFVPELNVLSQGISLRITEKNGNVKNIFVQARLICHIYDTMALLKVCKFPGKCFN
jgi:hypothetical protein